MSMLAFSVARFSTARRNTAISPSSRWNASVAGSTGSTARTSFFIVLLLHSYSDAERFAAAEPGNFGKLLSDGTRRARIDAERGLADAEDRFDLRIAVETLRHRAHLAADLARRVMLTVPAVLCALPLRFLHVLVPFIGAVVVLVAELLHINSG